MEIPLYQVNAFATGPFSGNPAAVCPLISWLPETTMQAIAAENNLSETAFYVPGEVYGLRWFTPTMEVDLCGHATLASAHVILTIRGELDAAEIRFETRSGLLATTKAGDLYTLDFPSRPPAPCEGDQFLERGLGSRSTQVLAARDYMCVFDRADQVRALRPDMQALAKAERVGIIATAPGEDCDFVSRFFAPAKGVPEDPVTGSAHCTLIPYWRERLGRTKLHARQISKRGGELWCEDKGTRVGISGRVTEYLTGIIEIPDLM